MDQIKVMASMQANKAFVATIIAMISAATLAASNGFTLEEIFTILGAGFITFQATYWTTNADSPTLYDGALIVDTSNPLKDTYSLEVTTPLSDVSAKSQIILKVKN